jgi:hypothetical protein
MEPVDRQLEGALQVPFRLRQLQALQERQEQVQAAVVETTEVQAE